MNYLNKQVKVVGGSFLSGHAKEFVELELVNMYVGGKNILILSEDNKKWNSMVRDSIFNLTGVNHHVSGSIKLIGTLIEEMVEVADEIIIEDKSLLHNSKILNSKANITLILNEVY